jgi:Rrf2 family protein
MSTVFVKKTHTAHGTGRRDDNGDVRISLKVDYALRAMAQLASEGQQGLVKAEQLAIAQEIPVKFLLGILRELKQARLVSSKRGAEGGYALSRPAKEISLADVIRAIDGPLANVHDTSLTHLTYPGPAAPLSEIWMALRTSLRGVFETVTLADLARGRLPKHVRAMADEYKADPRH